MSAAPSRSVETPPLLILKFIFLSGVLRVSARTTMMRRSLGVAAETRKTFDTFLNTTFADVPRNAECAERRASAPARPRRATA
jgi:hypothetical protein